MTKIVHLLTTRGAIECGQETPGAADPDINLVTCPACIASHEAICDDVN